MPLPKFEDWKAPWEDKDEQIDPERVKKLLYNLHRDVEVEKATVADTKTQLAAVTTDRDTVKGELDTLKRGDETETDRLRREVEELKARKPEVDPAIALENLKLQVALDKGLTAFQVKRLAGSTKEELEADADELLEAFGGNGSTSEENESGQGPGQRRPVPVQQRRRPVADENDDPSTMGAYSPEALEKILPYEG